MFISFSAIRSLLIGFRLLSKSDKSESEIKALSSFIKLFLSSLAIMVVYCVYIFIILGIFFYSTPNYSARRTGYVRGNEVVYTQGTMQSMSLESLGISERDVQEGDGISLYFDREDKLLGSDIEQEREDNFLKGIIYIFSPIIGLLVFAFVAKKTFGKAWVEYCKIQLNH